MELLLGCGHSRVKQLFWKEKPDWNNLVTLDFTQECNPDVVFDLNLVGLQELPFDNDTFDEIHAYNVLEHVGRQGDFRWFFEEFSEYWRVLKDKGDFFIVVPNHTSVWAWGDPGHTRILTKEVFSFLDQDMYKQLGSSSTSDYRTFWKHNFKIIYCNVDDDYTKIILRKENDADRKIQD